MKALLFSLLILLAAQQCRDENDDAATPQEGEVYTAADISHTAALEKWEQFLAESRKNMHNAEERVTAALDRLEDPGTKNKLLLEVEVVNAEALLEQLCEKLDRASRFKGIDLTDDNIVKMDRFISEYRDKEERLNKALAYLESGKFRK